MWFRINFDMAANFEIDAERLILSLKKRRFCGIKHPKNIIIDTKP
jgi:hypothetical protein